MTQVSGAISLDTSKVERNIVRATVDAITRTETFEESENQIPAPLTIIADAVAGRLGQLTSADLLRIERKVDALTELIRLEASRRDRLTGEIPVVVADPA